jgi:hypothetical protein
VAVAPSKFRSGAGQFEMMLVGNREAEQSERLKDLLREGRIRRQRDND